MKLHITVLRFQTSAQKKCTKS